MLTAKDAYEESKKCLWEKYERMIQENVNAGNTRITMQGVPDWAISKFTELGYEVVTNGVTTTIYWN